MSAIVVRTYQGASIRQREDGFLCLTDMAQAAGKRVNHWLSNQSTAEFLAALRAASRDEAGIPGSAGIPADRLVMVNESAGPNDQRGTWAHPLVASNFAQWCSPAFAVQVSLWVEDIRTKGYAIDARRGVAFDLAAAVRTPAGLQALALELTRVVSEQAEQLAAAAPKIAAHDRLANCDGEICLMDLGRVLGRKPRLFIRTLEEDGYLFRSASGSLEPVHEWRERGYFRVFVVATGDGADERMRTQTKVTAPGIQYFARKYERTDATCGTSALAAPARFLQPSPSGPVTTERGR